MFGVGLRLMCIIGTFQGLFPGLECMSIDREPVELIELHCGESITLKCDEFKEGNDENALWLKDNEVFPTRTNFLELLSVSTRNEGVYICIDSNTMKPIKRYEVTLHESNCRKD